MPVHQSRSKNNSKSVQMTKPNGHRVQKTTKRPTSMKRIQKSDRLKVMQDTIEQTPLVIKSTPGASSDSHFYTEQLPPISRDACPNLTRKPVEFILGDTFAVTRQIMTSSSSCRERGETELHHDKVAVLNMASDIKLAGATGIPSGPTQEDALCLSSTLYATLQAQRDKYPWKKSMTPHERDTNHCAGIYSPRVVIFKASAAEQYATFSSELQRRIVGVVSIAAPRDVKDSATATAIDSAGRRQLQEKIRMIARIAATNNKPVLVLGAMGCGKFNCDAGVVATTFRDVLAEDEFEGWFEQIVFAIYTVKTLDTFKRSWNDQK